MQCQKTEISLFYGIRVTMYYNDHMPPHFHAEYNGQKALVDINNIRDINAFKEACTVMNGTLAWDISGNRDESSCIDIDPFTVYELESINNLIA